nr:hypothetical protein [uncultured Gemmiger sp.]
MANDAARAGATKLFVPIRHNRFLTLVRLIFDVYLQKVQAKKRMTKGVTLS